VKISRFDRVLLTRVELVCKRDGDGEAHVETRLYFNFGDVE
jgi:hypothetical protein